MTSETNSLSTGTMFILMLLLAALDLAGAFLAKEWNNGRGAWLFLAGAGSFVVLFVVYALGLRYIDMSTITLGWIVSLQVAILLVERFHYGVSLPAGKWAAIVAILCLQAYLVLAPNTNAVGVSDVTVRQESVPASP